MMTDDVDFAEGSMHWGGRGGKVIFSHLFGGEICRMIFCFMKGMVKSFPVLLCHDNIIRQLVAMQ